MIEKLPKDAGVYVIRNKVSGRVYVGSSVDIRVRCRKHLRRLSSGTHDSWLLQKAWEKHGKEAFNIEVLEICGRVDRFAREEYWIAKLNAYMGEGGYNILPHAGTVKGRTQTVSASKRQVLTDGIRNYWATISDEERRIRCQEIAAATARDFIVTLPDGTEKLIFNLKQFCRIHRLSYNAMKKVAKFEQYEHKNYHVRTPNLTRAEAETACRERQREINTKRWNHHLASNGLARQAVVWRVVKDGAPIAIFADGYQAAAFLGITYGAAKMMRQKGTVVSRGPRKGYAILSE